MKCYFSLFIFFSTKRTNQEFLFSFLIQAPRPFSFTHARSQIFSLIRFYYPYPHFKESKKTRFFSLPQNFTKFSKFQNSTTCCLTQEESSLGARKDLDMLHGADFAAVVLDDKYEAWPKAARTNVIKVRSAKN